MTEIDALADTVLGALDAGRQIQPLSGRDGGLSMARAYEVGAAVTAARVARGARVVGRKIGFTNATIWEEYGVSAPIVGPMYDRTVRTLAPGFALDGLLEPRIEPEIAFRMSAAPVPGMSPRELMGCIGAVCAGFEIVQSLYPGWRFAAADTVAAFGLHGAFLHGPFQAVAQGTEDDWTFRLAGFETVLSKGGGVADVGHARNVLGGGPLVALAHLVRLAAEEPGVAPVAAGEIITTGTLTRALPVAPGETWHAGFGTLGLPPIEVRFA